MDGCTHNVSWIAGDKWRMIARMSFTSDCNLRDVFSKKILGAWSPVYMQTHAQAHTRTEIQTHAWMWKLAEVVEPWGSHERSTVHKANATLHSGTSKPSAGLHTSPRTMQNPRVPQVDHSQSFSEPERGYAIQWRSSLRWRPAIYSIHWYTIHNSSR